MKNVTPKIYVPEDEAARQATESLGGYVYQIEYSVLSWLRLGDDEVLHIEFAEDLAISDGGKLDLTQVKRLAANITLRSEGVLKLLTSVWEFQNKNPELRVSGALLTTSGMGKERKMTFPGKKPGLVYWRTASRAGADVEPIRVALLSLALPKDMLAFIKSASATELQSRILRQIRWLDEGPDNADVRRRAEGELILLGNRMGVPPTQSENARAFLIEALLMIIRKPPEKRFVTKADLLKIFEQKTHVTVPPSLLAGIPTHSQTTALTTVEAVARDLSTIPLSRLIAQRDTKVKQLLPKLVAVGALWFHGSSGLGKSTLAMLLARSQGVAWRFADLRDLSSSTVRSVLSGLASTFNQTGIRGLILDDLPAEPDNSLVSAIVELSQTVRDADGLLVITSMKPPQPSLMGHLELGESEVIRVPYLTDNDVKGMIEVAGGEPEKWARSITAFAGGGHPQLVAARVSGLARRGWNEAEMLASVIPLPNTPDDLEEERKAVRQRLLQELDDKALELLLRLSLLHAHFDRALAMTAADAPPLIPRSGLVFDYLLGPWIEQVGPERFRLSPLLNNSGNTSLTAHLQSDVRRAVMHDLMRRRPFPADQLLQVFIIAFQLNDKVGLTWFGHAVLSASTDKKSHFRRLAQEISIFAVVDRGPGKPLIPDDKALSTLLRFAQLRTAVGAGDMKQAALLVDRTLFEGQGEPLISAFVAMTVMIEPRIPIPPKRWLPMLLELIETPVMKDAFDAPLPTGGVLSGLPLNATHDEMLFVARGTSLQNPSELRELLQTLEKQPEPVQSRYIGPASRIKPSLHLIVAGSWLSASKKEGFDALAAATTYQELSTSDLAKKNADLAVELICAEATMRSDFADDPEGALEALRLGQEAYPSDYRLSRQRQKLFYQQKLHAEALAEFETFKDRMPQERTVDRAYAMREAGRSAAETGALDKASTFFGEAWASASLCGDGMKAMTAGLSADCAIVEFDRGNIDNALDLMMRGLIEAETLDPGKGLPEAYLRRVQGAAILYMRGAAQDFPQERQVRVYGMCSDPDPNKWFGEQPVAQSEICWYQLAELESENGNRDTVLKELRKRTRPVGLLSMEITLAHSLIEASMRNVDVDRFMSCLPIFPRAMLKVSDGTGIQRDSDPYNMPRGSLSPLRSDEWTKEKYATHAKSAILCFILACVGGKRLDLIEDFRSKALAIVGLTDIVRELFVFIEEPTKKETNVYEIIPSITGRLLKDDVSDASDVFLSATYLLQFLRRTGFGSVVSDALMPLFDAVWQEILTNRKFSVRSPDTNGPIILRAMQKGDTNFQRMANMTLATEAAVSRSLGKQFREEIAEIAKGRKPLALDHS